VVVGLGLDEDKTAFDRVYRKGQGWAELVWAPGLREKLGVEGGPTAWVVDTHGTARYYVDHWLSVEELDGYIRDLD